MNENSSQKFKTSKFYSWKTFLLALVIAFFLNIFASAATGTQPAKNILSTVLWMYLSIEAWKYWKWKALLPYPIFVATSVTVYLFIRSQGMDTLTSKLIANVALNIIGLIIFYLLYAKSQNDFILSKSDTVTCETVTPNKFHNSPSPARTMTTPQVTTKSPVQSYNTAATLEPEINEAMQEDDFWAQALEEFEGGHKKPGVWAKFYAEFEGNESQAKAKYLKYRAEQLYQENIDLSQLKRSAEEGDADAMFNLGLKYENGQGLKQDYAEAIRWFRKAAELGNADSQNNLAWLYATCKDSHYLNGMAAVKYALQAVNNDPNDYDGYDSLAAACARNSKFEKAIELMQKAINLLQNDGTLNSTDKSKALARFNMRLGLYLKQQPYTDDGEAF